jgi:hypothetical protein
LDANWRREDGMLWMILNSLVGVKYEIEKRLTDANFEIYLTTRESKRAAS